MTWFIYRPHMTRKDGVCPECYNRGLEAGKNDPNAKPLPLPRTNRVLSLPSRDGEAASRRAHNP